MESPQTSITRALTQLNEELDRLRAKCEEGDEVIYSIYAQPIEFRKQLLMNQLRALEYELKADLWIGLRGVSFDATSGPIDTVSKVFNKFQSATRHALSVFLRQEDTGGRFGKAIEEFTQFEFVGTAPGSLRLGLKQIYEPDDMLNEQIGCLSGDHQFQQIKNAEEKLKSALELLMVAFEANEGNVNSLIERVGEHGALRLLYHAGDALVGGVDSFEFSGASIGFSKIVPASRKAELRELGRTIVQSEVYVQGGGVLKMKDLGNLKFRFEDVVIDEMGGFRQMECDVSSFEYDSLKDESLWDQWVWFTGRLILDHKGKPNKLVLDTLDSVLAKNLESNS